MSNFESVSAPAKQCYVQQNCLKGYVQNIAPFMQGNDNKFYLQGLTAAAITPETSPAMTPEPGAPLIAKPGPVNIVEPGPAIIAEPGTESIT